MADSYHIRTNSLFINYTTIQHNSNWADDSTFKLQTKSLTAVKSKEKFNQTKP